MQRIAHQGEGAAGQSDRQLHPGEQAVEHNAPTKGAGGVFGALSVLVVAMVLVVVLIVIARGAPDGHAHCPLWPWR